MPTKKAPQRGDLPPLILSTIDPQRDIVTVVLNELVAKEIIARWCQDSTGLVRQYTIYGPTNGDDPAPQASLQVDLLMLAAEKHAYLAKTLADAVVALALKSPL